MEQEEPALRCLRLVERAPLIIISWNGRRTVFMTVIKVCGFVA